MSPDLELSKAATDLASLALSHGLESIRGGGLLTPFVLEERNGERDLHRFVTERLEESQEAARVHLRRQTGLDRCALAYDGYLTMDGERLDAICVEVHEAGAHASAVYAQRYRPAADSRELEIVGGPAIVGQAPPLL